jgi:hypothetical protein
MMTIDATDIFEFPHNFNRSDLEILCWEIYFDNDAPPFLFRRLSLASFPYARGRAAFESPGATTNTLVRCSCTLHSPNKLILLGGLSDGFMPTPYATPL